MVLKRFFAAIILALTVGVAHADAPPKMEWNKPLSLPLTKEVKAACEAKDEINQTYCYGVLMSLYDSNFYVADALEASPLCIPENTTPAQMRDRFLDVTNQRSDQLEGPISIFYYMAMDRAYPCAPGVPNSHRTKTKTKD